MKCCEHVCCTSQDKVQKVQKGAENLCHVRLLQSRDLYQQSVSQEIDDEPQHYHINVHVFGGTSSPSWSNYALRRTARDHERKYGKEVANTLREDFYVDDLLRLV